MTAKFAPVAPIQILQAMNPLLFGDYHLFLAHHTAENTEAFRDMIYERTASRPYSNELTIIMDNSIVELGGAVDDKMIYEACNACCDRAIAQIRIIPCLPDVMGSMSETKELSVEAYSRWNQMGMNDICGSGYMIVSQSENKRDLIDFMNYFFIDHIEKYRNITWIGIPRFMLKQGWESRKWAIRYIRMVAPHLKIHLLGFSDDLIADMFDAREAGVFGIDSAVPVRYDDMLTPDTFVPSRDPEWMKTGKLTSHGSANIQRVRRWISGQ